MKINFKEIIELKDFKKYSPDEPIFLSNYLFHYLILVNNINALKLRKFPIWKINEDGLNGIILAAKNKNYKILKYLIKTYPDYIYNTTDFDENFLHFLDPNDKEYLTLIKNKNIDWYELFNHTSKENFTSLGILLTNGKFKIIKEVIKLIKFKWDKYENYPSFYCMIYNNNLSNKEKIELLKIIEDQDKNIYTYLDIDGVNLFLKYLEVQNKDLLKYLSNKIPLHTFTPLSTYNTFFSSYNYDLNFNDNFDITNLIWSRIKDTYDFNNTNKYGENIAHLILFNRLEFEKGNYELEKKILKKCNNWNIQNINGNTPLHFIVQLDFDQYHKFLVDRKVNLKIKNKDKKNPLDLASGKWNNFLRKLPKEKEEKDDIVLKEYKYQHGNIFQSSFLDMGIFGIILENKYSQLVLPKNINNHLENVSFDNGIILPDPLLYTYLNFAWVIIINDHEKYWIHPNLNNIINSIRREKKYDYSIVFISLRLPSGGLHAGMIIYDFKRNTIERFEPYGNLNDILKMKLIDDLLEKKLSKETGMTYLRPSDFLPISGFQTISDELNQYKQKFGDFGGFCLAWCLWYVEQRLNNEKIKSKILVKKSIKKLINLDISFMEFIRNYANDINKERVKWLIKTGLKKNKTSNQELNKSEYSLIFNKLIKDTTK